MSSQSNTVAQHYGPGFAQMNACRYLRQAFPPAAIPCYYGISNGDAPCPQWTASEEPCFPGLSCCTSGAGWNKSSMSAGAMSAGASTCSSCTRSAGAMCGKSHYSAGAMAGSEVSPSSFSTCPDGSCPCRRGGSCPFGPIPDLTEMPHAPIATSSLLPPLQSSMRAGAACGVCPFAKQA